jgi:hypothetical protein
VLHDTVSAHDARHWNVPANIMVALPHGIDRHRRAGSAGGRLPHMALGSAMHFVPAWTMLTHLLMQSAQNMAYRIDARYKGAR